MAPLIAAVAAIPAAIGSTATAIGTAATVVGAGISAYSSIEQGQNAEKAAEYNATMANQQADEAAQQSKYKAFQLSQERRQMIGRQAALYGGAGVNPNEGTPLDVMSNTAAQYENDIYMAGLGADQATASGSDEASLDQMSGRQAAMAGWLGAGSSLMSGLGGAILRTQHLGGN